MVQRSKAALERSLALDPDLISAAGQLVINRVERRESAKAYETARKLVSRHSNSPQGPFALAYVLRYAGDLEGSTRECDAALALDPGNYQYRSCALSFALQGNVARAMEFLQLDAGSEWAAYTLPQLLLRENKIAEALEATRVMSANPRYSRDLLEACLESRAPQLDAISHEMVLGAPSVVDPEPLYRQGAVLAFCDKKESAVAMFKVAIADGYCALGNLQSDPLVSKLRQSPEFRELLDAARECQKKYFTAKN